MSKTKTTKPAKAKGLGTDLQVGVVAIVAAKDVHPDPDQPRKSFDETALQSLADNIRERGIQQPILVRIGDKGRIVIVDGERRWRAAKVAKLPVVPVLLAVSSSGDEQLRLDQVSVNQLREQLKPMDLARVLRRLRDSGKTPNEIAATLAKQGHPPMKPAAINDIATLTDLPEWTQSMIDRDLIEPAAAQPLLYIVGIPGVEKPLRKKLEQAAGYRGKLVGHDVKGGVVDALEKVAVNLGRVESWHPKPLVHFDFKSRCKGCEHLVRFGTDGFCLSRKKFEEHNQEAKDAGLLPGGRLPEKKKPVTGKAAEREQESKFKEREYSLTEKARQYLHAYLCVALIEELPKRPQLQVALSIWRALKSPGSDGSRGAGSVDAAIPATYRSIEQLCGEMTPAQLQHAAFDASLNVINELPWREVHALSRLLWGDDLHPVWRLNREFLDLFRKAELVHLATTHQCELPEGRKSWDALKGDDLKAALLAQPDKLLCPAILADLYQGEIGEPRKRWESGGHEDDDGFDPDDDDGGDATQEANDQPEPIEDEAA